MNQNQINDNNNVTPPENETNAVPPSHLNVELDSDVISANKKPQVTPTQQESSSNKQSSIIKSNKHSEKFLQNANRSLQN